MTDPCPITEMSAYVILENKGNCIWYYDHTNTGKTIRQMGLDQNTVLYKHNINTVDTKKWIAQDKKNGYYIAFGHEKYAEIMKKKVPKT